MKFTVRAWMMVKWFQHACHSQMVCWYVCLYMYNCCWWNTHIKHELIVCMGNLSIFLSKLLL